MSAVLALSAAVVDVAIVVAWISGGFLAAGVGLVAYWRVRSMLRIWRAPDRPLHSTQALIWRDPGDIAELDLVSGPGGPEGRPHPPFVFVEEHLAGSRPCLSVRDARGRAWRVKWGDEVNAEALATRLAWAAGYFAETTYYVAEGEITRAHGLQRAAGSIDENARFTNARFELDEEGVIKHFDEHSWAWNDNPFLGTRELAGLKIVTMWLSNWDTKDLRDAARGSNTAIFEHRNDTGRREARYLITDWGGAFGRWGSIVRRGRWDCHAFAAETAAFVTGMEGEFVKFGYTGQHTADIAQGIRATDARWLLGRLNRLSERQISDAVRASGGSPQEIQVFAHALRERIDRLAQVATVRPSSAA
jgi:hypothetical protein